VKHRQTKVRFNYQSIRRKTCGKNVEVLINTTTSPYYTGSGQSVSWTVHFHPDKHCKSNSLSSRYESSFYYPNSIYSHCFSSNRKI